MSLAQRKEVFLQAIELESAEERRQFVEGACQGDADLLNEVNALLEQHESDAGPVDQPLVERNALSEAASPLDAVPSIYAAGTTIGPYRLMEQIGEGGFGLVFVAEQSRPVRRQVALKIIKPGMETREVIARFEAERQALALMDHANIARVFDAGVTESKQPYFVMELVRGTPLNEFCDRHSLTTNERLEIFVSICHALHHAHQKGVIHRDLKPSNVLVSMQDGKPVSKVIDFGVAKAIGQSLTDKTIYTRFTSMVGTPAYMSPEQAGMNNVDVDTRSDIYSLGVLLYELLTGGTPFSGERLSSLNFDELRRVIREEEPPLPSARFSTLDQAAASTISGQRQVEPTRLAATIRGDLDWIVMKALDKDRNRRFDSANEFGKDIRRYLDGEPVEARPPSTLYRFSRFARRNRVSITTASIVLTALVLGTAISAWQALVAINERDEKDKALLASQAAEAQAEEARSELELFTERLKEASQLISSGRAHADFGRWSQAHDDLCEATRKQPKYYSVWVERGLLYLKLGLWDEAAADFSQALAIESPVSGPEWMSLPLLFYYTERMDDYRAMLTRLEGEASDPFGTRLRGQLLSEDQTPEAFAALVERADELALASQQRRPPGPGGEPGNRPEGPGGRGGGRAKGPGFEGPGGEGVRGGGRRGEKSRDGRRGEGFFGGRDQGPPQRGMPGGGNPGPPREGFDPGPPGGGMPAGAMAYLQGWAAVRAQDYKNAIQYFRNAENSFRWQGRGIHEPLLAVAYHQLGDADEALAAFERSEEFYEQLVEQFASDEPGRGPLPWFDWLEFLMHRKQASILIKGRTPARDSRLDELQSTSQQLLRGAELSEL